jgi:hypothetical protein
MRSRVHPKYKAKYRVGNWAEYDRALIQRGDITLWISEAAARQAEGFLRSVLSLMVLDLEAPDRTTLSRRSQHLSIQLARVSTKNPINLIVDSTGLSLVGEGEWAAAKYGGRGRRGWKKLHLGVDRSGVIVAEVQTGGDVNDAKTAFDVIDELKAGESGVRSKDWRRPQLC